MHAKIKQLAPWALSVLLGAALGYAVIGWYGGPVHFVGLRHLPGACAGCDAATAQSTMSLVNEARKAQTAPVGSAQ